MVARSPPNHKKMVSPLDPARIRETVNKVDKCMARLQELQYTIAGGNKVISGVTLSPRSTRGYLRTSLKCKQESLRIRNGNARKSPLAKLPINTGDWRRMSLPAMLLGETVGEIIQASQHVSEIVAAVDPKAKKSAINDPKTPLASKAKLRSNPENSELRARRKREKQITLHSVRSEASPTLQRAKSRISFKVSSPPKRKESEKENARYIANRVSPKNRPWARKTVLFPNPLFHSSPTSKHEKFGKTRSPVIAKNHRQTPHKFLIKSPVIASGSKFQVKIKSPPLTLSPIRPMSFNKKSPKGSTGAKLRRSFSPSRLASKLISPLKSRKLEQSSDAKVRRSFSPSRLASKFVSPLKSRKLVQTSDGMMKMMSGLKQRPSSSMQLPGRRI